MEYITHNLSLNMHSSISQESLYVKKGDTNRKLRITLTESGKVYRIKDGCVAVFYGKNEIGEVMYSACTIEDNAIVCVLTKQATAVIGLVNCQIKLVGADGGILSTPVFSIIVNDTMYGEGDGEGDVELRSGSYISYINLPSAGWEGTDSPYSQVVAIDGVTENSRVDINLSAEQLDVFYDKDIALVAENEDGVVTVYCIGQKPANDYTVQVTITEVITNG